MVAVKEAANHTPGAHNAAHATNQTTNSGSKMCHKSEGEDRRRRAV